MLEPAIFESDIGCKYSQIWDFEDTPGTYYRQRQVFYFSTLRREWVFPPLFEMSWIHNFFFDPIGIMNVVLFVDRGSSQHRLHCGHSLLGRTCVFVPTQKGCTERQLSVFLYLLQLKLRSGGAAGRECSF